MKEWYMSCDKSDFKIYYNVKPTKCQLHTCYNLISQSTCCVFCASETRHQEVSCKNTGIMVYCMSTYMVHGECKYPGITIQVIIRHIKVHTKKQI
jgi:hypothetical protein